jgi:hypothetical protein
MGDESRADCYREWADFAQYADRPHALFPSRQGRSPPQCEGLAPARWEEIAPSRLTVVPEGAGTVVDDPAGSSGKALQLQGSDPTLEGRFTVPQHLAGRWRIYAVVRADAATDAPSAIVAGVYAWNTPYGGANEVSRAVVPCGPEYQTIDLGMHRLEKGATIQVQPHGAGAYGQVKTTDTDRLFPIRAE